MRKGNMSFNNLSDMEIDAIGEIVNIGFGVASTAVSTLIRSRITITVPEVKVNELSIEDRKEERSIVEIKYLSGMTGTNILVLTKENQDRFVNLMMNTNLQSEEISKEISMSAACELMNQMMGAMATGLSDFLERKVNISTPISFEIENSEQIRKQYLSSEIPVVTTKFVMKSENGFYGEFWNIMSLEEARKLIEECMPEYSEEEEVSQEMVKKEREDEETMVPQVFHIQKEQGEGGKMEQDMEQEISKQLINQENRPKEQYEDSAQQQMMMMQMQQKVLNQMVEMMNQMQNMQNIQNVQNVESPKAVPVQPLNTVAFDMEPSQGVEQIENKELIMGVPLEVSVEIGRTKKSVREILEFTKGSLVVLDKLAGEQVDLFVNGRCIAKGDVVVVDDNFGIRITEIL
ncbi:MAG: flagellar motor switch protein FliN, partial [Clostridiales bacterium]|nr:flagellar motor switch protein FliN [Clostridiales bacterium]